MRNELVAYFEAHQKLCEASALELILENPQPLALSREVVDLAGEDHPVVTRELVEEAVLREAHRSTARAEVRPTGARGSSVPGPHPGFGLIAEGFSPLPQGREPKAAFEGLFQSRFEAISRLLRAHPELSDVRPISELGDGEGAVQVIAMVREVRQTVEQHHLILTVEDPSGAVEVLVPHDSPAARHPFIPDEVVGLRVTAARERGRLPRATAVYRPDASAARSTRTPGHPSRVLFLSDLHIGSRSFLSEEWSHLAEFLDGRGNVPEIAREIEHVVIAGDLVDGIGIYPDQERDLEITDIFEQYRELGRRLKELPARLNIIAIPGNHDAVCPAEPQPSLSSELREYLPANVRTVGNPSTFALEGVVVEAYHGRSFDDLIPAIPGASYARPTEVMKRMLLMRHLAPIYGGRTPMTPVVRDGLVIDPTPQILVTGHAHTFGVDLYHGILLLNASTWQAETEYQRMRNISPVPAHAAVVDLGSLQVTPFDFSRPARLPPIPAA